MEKSGVGCFMGGVYSVACGYVDDLKLPTPTVQALHIRTNICVEYPAKYDKYVQWKKKLANDL